MRQVSQSHTETAQLAPRRYARDRVRELARLAHRYVGLLLIAFHVTVGATGAILAYHHELDRAINPELLELPAAEADVEPLEPFELAGRVEQLGLAGGPLLTVHFQPEPNLAVSYWVPQQDGSWRQWFVSPRTAQVLGSRSWGDPTEGKRNLLPFLYRLHFSMGFGDVGAYVFGIASLLWTIDCFVGAYLTFPRKLTRTHRSLPAFLAAWRPAWKLRVNRPFSLGFTWHRASGLWLWVWLFVFAWSAVGFNLRPVYRPIMRGLVGMEAEGHDKLPQLTPPYPVPKLSVQEAYAIARRHMEQEARARGFEVLREHTLTYAADHGAFVYTVASSRDLSDSHPRTEVYLDGQSGRVLGFSAATGVRFGNTVSNWLHGLHTGTAFGRWYRPFIALMGMVVVALSMTGVWIWWRKRKKPRLSKAV